MQTEGIFILQCVTVGKATYLCECFASLKYYQPSYYIGVLVVVFLLFVFPSTVVLALLCIYKTIKCRLKGVVVCQYYNIEHFCVYHHSKVRYYLCTGYPSYTKFIQIFLFKHFPSCLKHDFINTFCLHFLNNVNVLFSAQNNEFIEKVTTRYFHNALSQYGPHGLPYTDTENVLLKITWKKYDTENQLNGEKVKYI